MPDLNQSNPLVLNYLKQNAIWWIGMQTSTVSESIPITILTLPNCILDKSNHRRIPKFQYCRRNLDAKPSTNGVLAKDSKIGAIKNYNSYLPSVMDFTLFDAIGTVFSEDDGSWDKGMVKVYDNFANDFYIPTLITLWFCRKS
jgi:hypothetical protein